ncbi:MAG: hypothetical protein JWN48_258 [Myxococcaceae bacterium]|nr:hypothetical protein [Myxococcaceae bacterium]
MGKEDDWEAVVAELKGAAVPRSHPALGRLHRMAVVAGVRALASFRELDDGVREGLATDLLMAALEKIIEAHRPRAYFVVAIRRRAIDQLEKQRRERPDAEPEAASEERDAGDPGFVLDARRALHAYSPRDQRILTAIALGEDRNELATFYRLSRAAIDQLYSRARRGFQEGSS